MTITNQNVKCSTMDDLLEVLKSIAPEEGNINIGKYREYMANLENSIKEKRKEESESILELEKNKKKYLEYAHFYFGIGMLSICLGYLSIECAARLYGLGDYIGAYVYGLASVPLGLSALYHTYIAFENIKNYIKAKRIEHKMGKN